MRTIQIEGPDVRALALVLSVVAWMLVCVNLMSHSPAQPPPHMTVSAEILAHRNAALAEAVQLRSELLWLARCVYSETKREHEQELVAWVVRNRVETRYRGKGTYQSVVLDPWQFSAFNADNPKRARLLALDYDSDVRAFQQALAVAARVMTASPDDRPFSPRTRHFYSARSMEPGVTPLWALDVQPIAVGLHVDPERFRFYDGVA